MPGATPIYGWPYPIGTDPLDDAVSVTPQALATAMENTLAALFAGGVPGAGWVTMPWAANWSTVAGQNGGRYSKYGTRVYVDAYGIRATSVMASGGTVATLPAGYRPTVNPTVKPCLINTGGTITPALCTISTAGVVTVNTSGAANIAISAAILLCFDFAVN